MGLSHQGAPKPFHDGFAVLIVLACLAALGTSVTAYSRSVITDVRFANYTWRNARNYGIALSFGTAAINTIRKQNDTTFWNRQPEFECSIGWLQIWFSVRNHKGLIDINAAGEELITKGLTALGVDVVTAKKAASEFLSVRALGEPDKQGTLISQQITKGPYKHGSSVSLIKPIEHLPYWDVSDIFTTYNRSQSIAHALAPVALQNAFGGSSNTGVENTLLNPFFTVRIAFARQGKIIDSWIIEYEVSKTQARKVAVITGDIHQRDIQKAARPCSEVVGPAVVEAARRVIE